VAIETAFVAPVLVLMSLGAFQISSIMARQAELQTAMDEAQAIALATDPDTVEERATLQQVIMASTDLPAENVTVTEAYRCGGTATYLASNTCATGSLVSRYVRIEVTATYTPIWTEYGVGEALIYNQARYVMYKQATNA
jgi:Flp pilus assembly protein TadG